MKPCQCGSPIPEEQQYCATCDALETAARLGPTNGNCTNPLPAPPQIPTSQRKLPRQAERLQKFMAGEWPYEKCFRYLQALTQDQRRELWEDIEFQVREEAQGRPGTDTIQNVQACRSYPVLALLPDPPSPTVPCCRCGSKMSQLYYDTANPDTLLWVCSRCMERGLAWLTTKQLKSA